MIKQIYKNREVKMKEQVGSINILSACFPYTIYNFFDFSRLCYEISERSVSTGEI